MRGQLAVQSSFHHCKQNKYVIETGLFFRQSHREIQLLETTSFGCKLSRSSLLIDILVIFCFQYHESEIMITWWNLKIKASENTTFKLTLCRFQIYLSGQL